MADYITDPDLLSQLNAPEQKDGYVTDPALLAQLGGGEPTPGGAAPQLPVSGYGPGVGTAAKEAFMATNVGQNIGRVAAPIGTAASNLMTQYAANPLTKFGVDAAAAMSGMPPPYASTQAIGGLRGAYNVATNLPSVPAPGPAPGAFAQQQILQTEMGQEMAKRLAQAEANPTAGNFLERMALKYAPASAAVRAVANTVGRVAGPAGLAYNVYEAGKMAQDTGLGQRLAQGEGQFAQQAFKQYNPTYGMSLTPDQARNILASGSPRDIQSFGGVERLRRLAGQ